MAKIILQKATIEDIPKIIGIENKLIGLKTFSPMTTDKEWQEEFKKGSKIYLIMDGQKIIGDASYEIKPDGSAYMSGLAIDPDFQGKGIGKNVFEQMIKELKDVEIITLSVHPENSRAIKIYLSAGFVIKGWKDNYYGDGEPRLEMVLEKK